MKLFWFADAVADLNEIYDHYITLNQRAAALLYNSILDEAEFLCNHPHIAQKEPLLVGLPEEYCSLTVAKGKYKLIYYIDNDRIYIVQVFACRRSPDFLKKTTIKRRL